MTVLDLGAIDGPLLVFGGAYGNLQATEALFAAAVSHGVSPRRMLCTGDLVAYCGDPAATVDLIRRAGVPVVMGNCEESVGNDADDCGCGFTPGDSCDVLSQQWYGHAVKALDSDAKAWMRSLPRRIALTMAGRRLLAVHGGVGRINQFVFPATPAADKLAEIAAAGADGVIGGHCGVPFTQILDGRLWHNSGASGFPANDGTPRAWYSVLRPAGGDIIVTHHALDYDHGGAARRMRAVGLPEAYAAAVESGLWPSDDIMPAADRAWRGQRLTPPTVRWPAPLSPAASRPDGAALISVQLWPR
jgi:predicted phosphodiesterase